MPPKKTETKAEGATKKSTPSYQAMITDAIVNLKDRNGSSRQSLKKYVRANNDITVADKMFDSLFNKALKTGVEKGIFEQPKGASGGTKLAKKAPPKKEAKEKKPAAKKEAAKKEPKEKKAAAPKKAAAKKETTKKEPKEKKAAAPKKAAPKKETKKAPAVVDKPTVLTKTKSGRVAKTKAAPKKAATAKKPAAKKEKAPKKADKPAEAASA